MNMVDLDIMILKKLIIGIIFLSFFNGCVQTTALLGPVYTLSTTGSPLQAGLSFGSDKAVNKLTGKSTLGNIKSFLQPKEEDSDFEKLIKKRIIETRKKMKLDQ